MPKIEKEISQQDRNRSMETKKFSLKLNMYKSSITTFGLAAVFLVISFVFNARLIPVWVDKINAAMPEHGEALPAIVILDIAIKSLSIILFFFFVVVSVGNFQELRGYVINWKYMIVLVILALIQGSTDANVFIFSLLGVAIILAYMYFIQARIPDEYKL